MNQKSIAWKFPLVIPVFLITLLIPWNNNEIKNVNSKDLNKANTGNKYVEMKYFPVLKISKVDMIYLFTKQAQEPKVHKLVFKFNINDAEQLNPSLTAFRAKQNGRAYLTAIPPSTLTRTSKTCEITGEYTLGNLEMHKDEWKSILDNAEDTDTYLYFYPSSEQYNGTGLYNIVYKLYWGTEAQLPHDNCAPWKNLVPPDGGLNPSPPADPS